MTWPMIERQGGQLRTGLANRKKIGLLLVPLLFFSLAPTPGWARGFIKPNIEVFTYRPTKNNPQYILDYIFGLYAGYSHPNFNIAVGINYILKKSNIFLAIATDYKWQVSVVNFLLGAEFDVGYPIGVGSCPTCRLQFMLAPRAGISFTLADSTTLGVMGKTYFPVNEFVTPYYTLALEATIGF